MVPVAHQRHEKQGLAQIVRLGHAAVVAVERLAEAENPIADQAEVAGLAKRQRHHRPVAVPRLGIDEEVRHRSGGRHVDEQFLVQHAQHVGVAMARKRRQLHRRLRPVQRHAAAAFLDPDGLLVFDDGHPRPGGRFQHHAIIRRHDEVASDVPLANDVAGAGVEQPAVAVDELRPLAPCRTGRTERPAVRAPRRIPGETRPVQHDRQPVASRWCSRHESLRLPTARAIPPERLQWRQYSRPMPESPQRQAWRARASIEGSRCCLRVRLASDKTPGFSKEPGVWDLVTSIRLPTVRTACRYHENPPSASTGEERG